MHRISPSENIPSEGATLQSKESQAPEGEIDNESLFMPKMVDLETSGQRCSPCIASQPKKKYNFHSAMSKFCAFGLMLTTSFMQPITVFSHAHACVTSAVHQCNVINANFDGSINAIHHMALAAGKSNNEVYTFREMLKQDDAANFVKAMSKEIQDHESRDHW